jgi:hypothetical protein
MEEDAWEWLVKNNVLNYCYSLLFTSLQLEEGKKKNYRHCSANPENALRRKS